MAPIPPPDFRELPARPDCTCPGCAVAAATPLPRTAASPVCSRATRLAAVTTMAGAALTGLGAAPAHATAPTHVATQVHANPTVAADSVAARNTSTRAEILARAQAWVDARVPYSMNSSYQGYRTDCSGFVSMAWGLGASHWTGDLHTYGVRITKEQLQPGDMLLFHNSANPTRGSHVVLFAGWANRAHTRYTVMEQAGGRGAVKRTAPYAYFRNSSSYVPYRLKGLRDGGSSGGGGSHHKPSGAFPGADRFGPGARNAYVTRLGRMLVARGGGRFYPQGPGPRWTAADQAATRAFQRAQGWSGPDADGIPGAHTWRLLIDGAGHDIAGQESAGHAGHAPDFPGTRYFGPGRSNAHVQLLGQQLVRKGYGQSYRHGPSPAWSESDRRAVVAFQRAQGWTGADADGYPGPETWRVLFP
ncbi:peptidoglycan-binding protein [Streptomyces sp. NPDC086554]|uniref:peptidoglycan-binding protein n=1 Tax=Streptomyces sp. NPDC086554 TaxID=3154864 RepID=UPI00344AF62F